MKFLIITPDGLGIRNFLCGRFIELLLSKAEVVVWHSFSETTLAPHRERWGNAVRWATLPSFREGLTERVLRQAKIYAQLYWRYDVDNSDLALRFLRPSGRLRNHAVAFIARWLGRTLSTARGMIWLDKQHARATLRANYLKSFEDLLARERPDVLFCTHQRSSRAVPAMLAARAMGIPTATFIYSWDNLPKGRMAVHADHFLVWSDLMKEELLCYYPEVAPERIHVVGTPQFEHYFNQSLVQPREQFLTSVGLDPSRSVICFSGDDLTSSPYDPVYLADLAGAMRKIPAERRPQILFRRCPGDISKRYLPVLDQYREIATSDPLWLWSAHDDWSQVIPTIGDVALLTNVVQHSDLVVNVGSTMAVDFAVFGKPAIYIAYNPPSANGSWNIHESYRFAHLRSVHELQPVYWADSADKLAGLVMHALSNPEEKLQARCQWMKRLIAHPLDQASRRCYEALERIIQ